MTKILTAAEMRAIDARTIEAGLPDLVLMENAAHRVVEVLEREFAPLDQQRIVIFAGKGNNGGDGLAIARLLHSRFAPRALDVVLAAEPHPQHTLLRASGFTAIHATIPERARQATLVIDALLGTAQYRGWSLTRANESRNNPRSVRDNPGAYRSSYYIPGRTLRGK